MCAFSVEAAFEPEEVTPTPPRLLGRRVEERARHPAPPIRRGDVQVGDPRLARRMVEPTPNGEAADTGDGVLDLGDVDLPVRVAEVLGVGSRGGGGGNARPPKRGEKLADDLRVLRDGGPNPRGRQAR